MWLNSPKTDDCRTYNEPSRLRGDSSQITKTLACISAIGLVIASAGFGAVFAWTSGASHGLTLAVLMVTMAIALELAKPIAVSAAFMAFRSWAVVRGLLLTLLAVVAVGFSLVAELQLVASSRGDVIAKREAAIESHDDRRAAVKSARAELATLAPSRTIEEAKADVVRLLAANPKAGDCRNSIVSPETRYICPKVAVLQGEAARAKRRGELQAVIDKGTASSNPAGTAKSADPGSAALATYLGSLGIDVSAGRLGDWLVLVPVLALEIGAALSVLLVQAVSGSSPSGPAKPSQGKQEPDTSNTTVSAPADTTAPDTESRASRGNQAPNADANRTPRIPKKRTRGKCGKGGGGGQSGKRRLGNVVDLIKARGGQLQGGQRAIAKQLRLSKSRANEVLHEAAAAGLVRLSTSRSGTSVAIAAA